MLKVTRVIFLSLSSNCCDSELPCMAMQHSLETKQRTQNHHAHAHGAAQRHGMLRSWCGPQDCASTCAVQIERVSRWAQALLQVCFRKTRWPHNPCVPRSFWRLDHSLCASEVRLFCAVTRNGCSRQSLEVSHICVAWPLAAFLGRLAPKRSFGLLV